MANLAIFTYHNKMPSFTENIPIWILLVCYLTSIDKPYDNSPYKTVSYEVEITFHFFVSHITIHSKDRIFWPHIKKTDAIVKYG